MASNGLDSPLAGPPNNILYTSSVGCIRLIQVSSVWDKQSGDVNVVVKAASITNISYAQDLYVNWLLVSLQPAVASVAVKSYWIHLTAQDVRDFVNVTDSDASSPCDKTKKQCVAQGSVNK